MLDYRVAVPCWGPPKRLLRRTLPMLLGGGVPGSAITLYVHESDPHGASYRDIAAGVGARAVMNPDRGLPSQRALAIADQPAGARVVAVCDDVTRIFRPTGEGRVETVHDVDAVFREMFDHAEEVGAFLWGMRATPRFWFDWSPTVRTGLWFIFGSLYGYVNRPGHPVNRITTQYKEDYERSLRYWDHDGTVCRADFYAPDSRIRQTSGAIGRGDARRRGEREEADRLVREWPGLVRHNVRRSGEYAEILLSKRPRKDPAHDG